MICTLQSTTQSDQESKRGVVTPFGGRSQVSFNCLEKSSHQRGERNPKATGKQNQQEDIIYIHINLTMKSDNFKSRNRMNARDRHVTIDQGQTTNGSLIASA